jgi:tRNA U34 2-thiouridine synthase MnmA/TrmU
VDCCALGERGASAVLRELAREHHLALAEKPDSQEICFVPGGDYKRFIDAYLNEQGEQLPDTSGELVTTDGTVLGHHEGVHNFTVGQRKGLGVAAGSPLYVININGAEGKVTVGGNDDLLSRTLIARDLNWIAVDGLHDSGTNANTPMRVTTDLWDVGLLKWDRWVAPRVFQMFDLSARLPAECQSFLQSR